MTEESPQGATDDTQPAGVQPWFPPAPPGGYAAPGGYDPAGGYGPPGGYAQPGGYFPPPPGGYGGGPWQAPPAPKPGVIPLRPIGVGEILDGGFTSIRRNPKATLGLAAIILTISAVITTGAAVLLYGHAPQVPPAGTVLSFTQAMSILGGEARYALPVALVSFLVAFVMQTVLTGLLTAVIGRGVLGDRLSAGAALRTVRSRVPALLGAAVASLFIVFSPLLVYVALLVGMRLSAVPGVAFALIAVFCAVATLIGMAWLWTRLCLAVPAVVLERLGPLRALARSWRLVRGSGGRVFGIQLLTWIIVFVAAAVLQFPFSIATTALQMSGALATGVPAPTVPGLIVSALGSIVAGTVTRPLAAAVTVLLYVDLRMRREGLDLVLRAASGSGTAGDEFASVWRPGAGSLAAPAGQAAGAAASPGTPPVAGPPPAAGPPAAW